MLLRLCDEPDDTLEEDRLEDNDDERDEETEDDREEECEEVLLAEERELEPVGHRCCSSSSSNVQGVQELPSGNSLIVRKSLQDCVHIMSCGSVQEIQISRRTQSRQV